MSLDQRTGCKEQTTHIENLESALDNATQSCSQMICTEVCELSVIAETICGENKSESKNST